jgi:aarF domain-containing kinase
LRLRARARARARQPRACADAPTRPARCSLRQCAALALLHAHVPPHAWPETRRAVAAAFGAPLEAVFSSFDPTPLGSGSIAQVYRARLAGDTADVAVKVRHPGVVSRMRTDFALLAGLAWALESVPALAWLGLVDSLAQFAHAVSAQVRLDVEGANLARLIRNFRGSPHVAAAFPAPRPAFVAESVLVESYEAGRPLDDAVAAARAAAAAAAGARAAAALHPKQHHGDDAAATQPHPPPLPAAHLDAASARHVVRAGNEAYLHMLLVHNFIHSDLHPGNILLRERPGAPPVLVLVDAGMVDELSARDRETFVGLFTAMGAGDGRAAAAALLGFAARQPAPPAARAAFADAMDDLFARHCRGFRTGADVGVVLRASLGAVREHGVRIDGRFATAVVNLLCIESFASALDPGYSILDGSELLLRAHAAVGPRALGAAMHAAAPAIAAARAVSEALTWRLPHAARAAWAAARGGGGDAAAAAAA